MNLDKISYQTHKQTEGKKKTFLDFMKIKNFLSKYPIKELKRPPKEWENLLASDIFEKGPVSWICKEFLEFNIKRKQKIGKGLE